MRPGRKSDKLTETLAAQAAESLSRQLTSIDVEAGATDVVLRDGRHEIRVTIVPDPQRRNNCAQAILDLLKDCPFRWTTPVIVAKLPDFSESTIKWWLSELVREGKVLSHKSGVRGYCLPGSPGDQPLFPEVGPASSESI